MSEATLVPNLSELIAAKEAETIGARAATDLRQRGIVNGGFDDDTHIRMFLSPQYPTGKYLVQKGQVRKASNMAAPLGMESLVSREGDIWVKFTAGVVSVDEDEPGADEIINWLEGHSGDPDRHADYHYSINTDPRKCTVPVGLCHEAGPGVDAWAELKAGQVPTARRPATISPELDVDAFLRGDHLQGKSLKTGEGARAANAAANNEAAARERRRGQRNNV